MYQPTGWPQLAERLVGFAKLLDTLNATAVPTRRSFTEPLQPVQKRQSSNNITDPATDYSFQGVTCADAIDAGNVTTKEVFDFLVHITRTVSPMCTRSLSFCCTFSNLTGLRYLFSWTRMGRSKSYSDLCL